MHKFVSCLLVAEYQSTCWLTAAFDDYQLMLQVDAHCSIAKTLRRAKGKLTKIGLVIKQLLEDVPRNAKRVSPSCARFAMMVVKYQRAAHQSSFAGVLPHILLFISSCASRWQQRWKIVGWGRSYHIFLQRLQIDLARRVAHTLQIVIPQVPAGDEI